MAAFSTFQPKDYFSTLLYSYASSPNAITGAGFAPDAVSLKGYSGTSGSNNWYIANTVMGNTKTLRWNDATAETTTTDSILSFDSDGYTLGADATANCNATGTNYVGYNWKAGTTSGISGGTITPTAYSISTTAGQSIIAYTGTGSAATIPHGLGVAPDMIIVKRLGSSDNWNVGHTSITWDFTQKLNNSSAKTNDNTIWNDTAPDATVFSIGTSTEVNTNLSTYIAYCFADKSGYSQFSSYLGNSAASGTFQYTGFRPAFVMTKRTPAVGDWMLFDNKRLGYNVDNNNLNPNLSGAQGTTDYMDILSNGFKMRTTDALVNDGSTQYLYAAFAEFPFVSSNDVPGVAR